MNIGHLFKLIQALTFAVLEYYSEHILGRIDGDGKKQLLIALAGVHGNEPAGIEATKRVLKVLENSDKPFYGSFLAIAGNLKALKENKRYIKTDLNRIWDEQNIAFAKNGLDPNLYPEHKTLREILSIIESAMAEGYDEVAVIDLHTTSAEGGVFIICPNDEIHRKMIERLPVPAILNLSEDLKGTAIQYFWERGYTAFAFEGGSHKEAESVDKMESAIWLCLKQLQSLPHEDDDIVNYHDHRLTRSTEGLPRYCQLIYHHFIRKGDEFKMVEGFGNFHPVEKGQVLAHDQSGPILCPDDGFILMPLYQDQGSDGFFIINQAH